MVIAIESLILYDPLAAVDVTVFTMGAVPSTTMAFVAPKEPAVPGKGNVKTALFPLASLMVPPFKNNASVRV